MCFLNHAAYEHLWSVLVVPPKEIGTVFNICCAKVACKLDKNIPSTDKSAASSLGPVSPNIFIAYISHHLLKWLQILSYSANIKFIQWVSNYRNIFCWFKTARVIPLFKCVDNWHLPFIGQYPLDELCMLFYLFFIESTSFYVAKICWAGTRLNSEQV